MGGTAAEQERREKAPGPAARARVYEGSFVTQHGPENEVPTIALPDGGPVRAGLQQPFAGRDQTRLESSADSGVLRGTAPVAARGPVELLSRVHEGSPRRAARRIFSRGGRPR